MSYYNRFDSDLCSKLRHLNQLVKEEWITASEALATARALDPQVYVCPHCGALGATGCDCTIQLDPKVIQEAINHDRN